MFSVGADVIANCTVYVEFASMSADGIDVMTVTGHTEHLFPVTIPSGKITMNPVVSAGSRERTSVEFCDAYISSAFPDDARRPAISEVIFDPRSFAGDAVPVSANPVRWKISPVSSVPAVTSAEVGATLDAIVEQNTIRSIPAGM